MRTLLTVPIEYEIKDSKVELDLAMIEDAINEGIVAHLMEEGYEVENFDENYIIVYNNLEV